MRRPKAKKRGTVRKIIKPLHPADPENADELYREIRVENALEDEEGNKVKLKQGAEVDVVIEVDQSATIPNKDHHS
jgi:hypothetical protein